MRRVILSTFSLAAAMPAAVGSIKAPHTTATSNSGYHHQYRFLDIKKLDNMAKPSDVFAEGAADAVVDGKFQQGAQEMKEGVLEGAVKAWETVKDTAKAAGSVLKDDGGSKAQKTSVYGGTAAPPHPANETFTNRTGKPTWENEHLKSDFAAATNGGQSVRRGGSGDRSAFASTASSSSSSSSARFKSEREYVDEVLDRNDDCGMNKPGRTDGRRTRGSAAE